MDEYDYLNLGNGWGMGAPSINVGGAYGTAFNNSQPSIAPFIPGTVPGDRYSGLLNTQAGAASTGGGGWLDGFLGKGNQPGWGGLAIGAASGLMNGYLGLQQYGLAKDTLKENKKQFALNYGAQKTTTNNQIASLNTARAASREGASNPYNNMALVA